MRKWIASFKDTQEAEIVEEGDGDEILRRYETAKISMTIADREVWGMHILETATEQEDVIRLCGLRDPDIEVRYNEYNSRTPRKRL